MEEVLDNLEHTDKKKVFKKGIFWAGPFLGGPFVAGYILAENFKALNQPEKVKTTWVITILTSFAIFALIFSLPENFPNQFIPILYSSITFFLFKKYQEKEINKHINNGGPTHGGWTIAAMIILGIMTILVSILAIFFFIDTLFS